MANNSPTRQVELGANMDYQEHEKTYRGFLSIAKYGTLVTVAILAAMAFGFFTPAGFFSASIFFVLFCVVGAFLLR